MATANRRLAKKRVQWLNEALCFVSSSVLADSLVLRNPLLRQPETVIHKLITLTLLLLIPLLPFIYKNTFKFRLSILHLLYE